MRLIDADAIPYTMLYKEDWIKGTGQEKQGAWKDDIDKLPTIEAEPVRRGRWITRGDCIDCSECRNARWSRTPFEDLVKHFNYCPNCGAIMEK